MARVKSTGPLVFREFDVTCGNCQSEITVESIDDIVVTHENDEGQGRSWDAASTKCLVCGDRIRLPYQHEKYVLEFKQQHR